MSQGKKTMTKERASYIKETVLKIKKTNPEIPLRTLAKERFGIKEELLRSIIKGTWK